jgi:hypothetical protein
LVKEPWTNKSKICGLSGTGNVYYRISVRPRAGVILANELNHSSLETFCSGDAYKNWKVHGANSFSDESYIMFSLKVFVYKPVPKSNRLKTDRTVFSQSIRNN